MDRKQHWDTVYQDRSPDAVSWYQARPEPSLSLIDASCLQSDAAILDVGGGASNLVDHLLAAGYADLTVLDLSEAALDCAKSRLGEEAARVHWLETDITRFAPSRRYALWHDRAVLHFLTDPDDQGRYREALLRGTRPGSHVIIGTFAPDGPRQCSGLDVTRYSHTTLQRFLGAPFRLREHRRYLHKTPWEAAQRFLFAHFQRLEG